MNGHSNSAILSFVDECVNQVKVSASTFRHVAEFYDDTQLAELTLLIGHYMMTARFLETLEIDPDEKASHACSLSGGFTAASNQDKCVSQPRFISIGQVRGMQ